MQPNPLILYTNRFTSELLQKRLHVVIQGA